MYPNKIGRVHAINLDAALAQLPDPATSKLDAVVVRDYQGPVFIDVLALPRLARAPGYRERVYYRACRRFAHHTTNGAHEALDQEGVHRRFDLYALFGWADELPEPWNRPRG